MGFHIHLQQKDTEEPECDHVIKAKQHMQVPDLITAFGSRPPDPFSTHQRN